MEFSYWQTWCSWAQTNAFSNLTFPWNLNWRHLYLRSFYFYVNLCLYLMKYSWTSKSGYLSTIQTKAGSMFEWVYKTLTPFKVSKFNLVLRLLCITAGLSLNSTQLYFGRLGKNGWIWNLPSNLSHVDVRPNGS